MSYRCMWAVLGAAWLAGCAMAADEAPAAGGASAPAYDLVIRNATVIDGTGRAGFRGDVAVRDGRIAAVGRVPAGSAAREIDAAGLAVAPGFIDVHTHADEDVHRHKAAENFVRDGVTTIVTGNCGGSVRDVGAYLARVDREGCGVNVATLVGHNTVLRQVKGDVKRPLTAEELKRAQALVERAMLDGAMGLSTGLIYNPGQFSSTEEIVELARPAAKHGGLYATHMRSESGEILAAIDEALRVGREAGCRVQISHFKLPADASRRLGGPAATLGKVLAARAAGQEVWLDQYPYTASSTSITTLILDEDVEAGVEAARKRLLDDPEARADLVRRMTEHYRKRGRKHFGYVVIASFRADPKLNGRNVLEIARGRKAARQRGGELVRPAGDAAADEPTLQEQVEVIVDLFARGGAQCVFHTMNEQDVEAILRSPIVAVGSDSGIRVFGNGVPHPRGYGTNARVLGVYARQKKVISMEEAVRRMTSLPAHSFRMKGRGRIEVGFAADLVLFDPEKVIDRATFDAPHQYPDGIPTVIVNGVEVLRDGKLTGKLPGRAVHGPGRR